MRMSVETLIDAPPQVVFAAIADIESWPSAISAIAEVTLLTPGPVAVGTRFRETREMLGRKATEEMTVAEIERWLSPNLAYERQGEPATA